MTVGTMAWAQRTDGRLRWYERMEQLFRGVRATFAARRPGPVAGHVKVAEKQPDSAFAKAVLELASTHSSEPLLAHVLRTWLWADLLAQADRVRHDRELLYAACILHDLALTPAYWGKEAQCFAVEGARAARAWSAGIDYPRADDLAHAICLHLNVAVPRSLGEEAHLLNAGAAMDVVGAGARRFPSAVRAEVLRLYPRDGFADVLASLMNAQVELRPKSRAALLCRLGMIKLSYQADRVLAGGRVARDGTA